MHLIHGTLPSEMEKSLLESHESPITGRDWNHSEITSLPNSPLPEHFRKFLTCFRASMTDTFLASHAGL